jgi:hypothetical protein
MDGLSLKVKLSVKILIIDIILNLPKQNKSI